MARSGVVVGLLLFSKVWAQSLEPSPSIPKVRCELELHHQNDAQFLGGDDAGLTFGNRILFRKKTLGEDSVPRQWSFRFENKFFTEWQNEKIHFQNQTPQTVLARSSDGSVYVNYLEEISLSVSRKEWDSELEKKYTEWGCELNYEGSSPTPTGSRLQSAVHREAGMKPAFDKIGVYDYSRNEYQESQWGAEVFCRQGQRWDWSPMVGCEAWGEMRLSSLAWDDSSMSLGAQFSWHAPVESAFDHDHTPARFYARWQCQQYFDFENRDHEMAIGIEGRLSTGDRKRLGCRLEWVKPLEVNETLHKGMVDQDDQLHLSFILSF